MMTAAFRAAGYPHTYTPVAIAKRDELPRALRLIRDGRMHGANVTLPFKRDVLKHVDAVDPSAEKAGAANVIAVDENRRLVAHNTDVGALEAELGAVVTGRARAAILGAGGGAMAAIAACKNLGFAIVGVTTRSWGDTAATHEAESAARVREMGGLTAVWPAAATEGSTTKLSMVMRLQWAELAERADLLVQATSAGMLGGPPGEEVAGLVPFEKVPKTAVAFDLVYRPAKTPFLLRAEAAGLRGVSGLGMLVRQAEATYRIWLGEDPPEGVMRKAAETVVAATVQP